MQPFVEPVPESRLADVLLGELFPRQEVDDTYVDIVLDDLEVPEVEEEEEYALFEIERDLFATTEFVRARDTRYDHIVTVEFPRTAPGDVTAPVPQVSAPYERIEIVARGDSQRIERVSVDRVSLERIDIDIEQVDVAQGEIEAAVEQPVEPLELSDLEFEPDLSGVPREEHSAQFMSYVQALPFPLYSAPFERVELGELPVAAPTWPDDSTDIVMPARATGIRVFALVLVFVSVIAVGVGLAMLVLRSATV
jgi:hypothetical protein